MPDPSPSQIDSLLEQCILLLEASDETAVTAILEANPAAAAQLRERLGHLSALGILQARKPSAAIPESLGEFRLLHQIGRGGMGIVYLAEQTALQRKVALKLVHPEQLFFGGARERFRREILAVARLQHPGIVPILTSGEAESIPFYAMELVQGASLAEVLAELVGTAPSALDGPMLRNALQRAMVKKHDITGVQDAPVFEGSWGNVCCRLALAAAEALQHAHDQGVLHRDIKPSNLLLTATGRIRVIDFGLASARGEQKLTRSGATFGSLPYMAPEQVRGDVARVDARSDVYALGVTLYELLTLSLPYGDGSGDTREHILAGHTDPPSRRNALVHPDAEAVCLLAMDLDPARRYQSAAALAQDLRAFLEHRTVKARRPSLVLRSHRWAKRNPARAAGAVVAFFLFVPAPLVFAIQQNAAAARIQHALDAVEEQRTLAQDHLRAAESEQRRAEHNRDQALRAVDLMLLRTADARLSDVPHTAELRRQLLQDAVALHESLITPDAKGTVDPRVREERARSQARLGALQADLGDLDKAQSLLRSAVDALEELLPSSHQPDALRTELANAYGELGSLMARTDRFEDMEVAQRRAISLNEAISAAAVTPQAVENTVRLRLALASGLERQQRAAEAHTVLDDLERQFAEPAGGPASLPPTRRVVLLAQIADKRGILLARTGDTQAAQRSWQEAMRLLDTLPDAARDEAAVRGQRLGILERAGLIAHQRREWDQAAPLLDRACREYESLLQSDPAVVAPRLALARMLSTRASNLAMLENMAAAAIDHDRAIELLTKGLELSPRHSEFRRNLAIALAERATWHRQGGEHAEAVVDFERAEQQFLQALTQRNDDLQTKSNLAAAFANHANVLVALGELAEARALSARAIEMQRSLPGNEGERTLIELLCMASDVAMRDSDEAAAIELIEEANRRVTTFLAQAPDDGARLVTAALVALNHGTMSLSMQQMEKAVTIFESSVPLARRAALGSPMGRRSLALMLLRLADCRAREDRMDEAREWFRTAVAETGITKAQLAGFEPLLDLFDRPDFAALLPPDHPDR